MARAQSQAAAKPDMPDPAKTIMDFVLCSGGAVSLEELAELSDWEKVEPDFGSLPSYLSRWPHVFSIADDTVTVRADSSASMPAAPEGAQPPSQQALTAAEPSPADVVAHPASLATIQHQPGAVSQTVGCHALSDIVAPQAPLATTQQPPGATSQTVGCHAPIEELSAAIMVLLRSCGGAMSTDKLAALLHWEKVEPALGPLPSCLSQWPHLFSIAHDTVTLQTPDTSSVSSDTTGEETPPSASEASWAPAWEAADQFHVAVPETWAQPQGWDALSYCPWWQPSHFVCVPAGVPLLPDGTFSASSSPASPACSGTAAELPSASLQRDPVPRCLSVEHVAGGACRAWWTVELFRLCRQNRMLVSPTVETPLGSFKIVLRAVPVNEKRGGGSLKKAKGNAFLELKCLDCLSPGSVMNFSFLLGHKGSEELWHSAEQDFGRAAVYSMGADRGRELLSAADGQYLVVCLETRLVATGAASQPSPSQVELPGSEEEVSVRRHKKGNKICI